MWELSALFSNWIDTPTHSNSTHIRASTRTYETFRLVNVYWLFDVSAQYRNWFRSNWEKWHSDSLKVASVSASMEYSILSIIELFIYHCSHRGKLSSVPLITRLTIIACQRWRAHANGKCENWPNAKLNTSLIRNYGSSTSSQSVLISLYIKCEYRVSCVCVLKCYENIVRPIYPESHLHDNFITPNILLMLVIINMHAQSACLPHIILHVISHHMFSDFRRCHNTHGRVICDV